MNEEIKLIDARIDEQKNHYCNYEKDREQRISELEKKREELVNETITR